jgi:hypothetical protein
MKLVQAILDFANGHEDPSALPIEQRADLAERALSGAKLTLGESQYLGALLLAEKGRHRGQNPRRAAIRREIAIAARLLEIFEGKKWLAKEKTAAAFKCSVTTVRNALDEQEPSESLEAMFAQLAAAASGLKR